MSASSHNRLLSQVIDIEAAAAERESSSQVALWPFDSEGEDSHLPSAAVRWFKNQRFAPGGKPLHALCRSLAEAIAQTREVGRCTHVSRALGSWETAPSDAAPLEVLARELANVLGATLIHPMRRTSIRRPMSQQPFLGGSAAVAKRIRVISDDIIMTRETDVGHLVVLDDIACAGATAGVWSWVAKELLGAESCVTFNLASFVPGSPALRLLESDPEQFRERACRMDSSGFFDPVWIDGDEVSHCQMSCSDLAAGRSWWRGLAGRRPQCPWCSLAWKNRFRKLRSNFRR